MDALHAEMGGQAREQSRLAQSELLNTDMNFPAIMDRFIIALLPNALMIGSHLAYT